MIADLTCFSYFSVDNDTHLSVKVFEKSVNSRKKTNSVCEYGLCSFCGPEKTES